MKDSISPAHVKQDDASEAHFSQRTYVKQDASDAHFSRRKITNTSLCCVGRISPAKFNKRGNFYFKQLSWILIDQKTVLSMYDNLTYINFIIGLYKQEVLKYIIKLSMKILPYALALPISHSCPLYLQIVSCAFARPVCVVLSCILTTSKVAKSLNGQSLK